METIYIAVCGEDITVDKDFDHFVSNIREVYGIEYDEVTVKSTAEEAWEYGQAFATADSESGDVRIYKIIL